MSEPAPKNLRSGAARPSESENDATNRRLIELLAEDGRLSFSELARRVHLSTPSVIARVRRLEEKGTIRGYHAHVDPAALGLPISICVLLKCTRAGERLLRNAALTRFPELTECHLVTGDLSFVLRASLASVEHVHEFLERVGEYGESGSVTVLESLALPQLPAVRPLEDG